MQALVHEMHAATEQAVSNRIGKHHAPQQVDGEETPMFSRDIASRNPAPASSALSRRIESRSDFSACRPSSATSASSSGK